MKLHHYAIQSLATKPIPAIQREEPPMTKDDMRKMLDQFATIIGCLEHKWQRPQSEIEAIILQMLLDMRETVRKAYEALGITCSNCGASNPPTNYYCSECGAKL